VKRCSKCHIEKELSEFYFRHKGKRAGEYYNHCKECLKSRGRTYYQENHDRQLRLSVNRNRVRRAEQRIYVSSLKNHPCVDCGKKYPSCVMDFDHRDGSHKHGNVGSLVSQAYFTKDRLFEEIQKCDLVCANCHRIRTFNRNHKKVEY
jgi:hypothetical protein